MTTSRSSRFAGLVMMAAATVATPGAAALTPLHVRPTSLQDDIRVERAVKMIQQDRLAEAVQLLDAVLADSDDHWEAHYQRGRALGLRGAMEEALPALERALELRPGHAHAHELAALAAWETGRTVRAWDHIVHAYLGGAQVEELIGRMASIAAPPHDFLDRLAVPRVFVAPLDLEEIETRAERPFDRNPMARQDPGRSGVPEEVLGPELVREAWADLRRVHGEFERAIARSDHFGLVLDLDLAEYLLRVEVEELGERPPRRLEGRVSLVARESGRVGYARAVRLRQIEARGELQSQIGQLVAGMDAWLASIRESERR